MTEQNTVKGFFNLPPEIRNKIYELAFTCHRRKAYNPVLHYRQIQPCGCFAQPLMRVSRQMRSETVSLHYNTHEFHFVLYSPNKAVLLSWLDNVARDSVPCIRRFVIKRYVEGQILYLGERIKTITIDLNGEQSETEIRVAGNQMDLPGDVHQLLCDLPCSDGRQELSREKLLEMFDAVGWH